MKGVPVYRKQPGPPEGVPLEAEAPSALLHGLAARVWHDVTDGAGVVHARHLSKPPQELTEANFKGIASAEAARLRRHARLKKEAAEAKKKGGKP